MFLFPQNSLLPIQEKQRAFPHGFKISGNMPSLLGLQFLITQFQCSLFMRTGLPTRSWVAGAAVRLKSRIAQSCSRLTNKSSDVFTI